MIEELGWKIIYDILNWDTQKAFVLLYFLLSIYKILLNKNRKIDHLHHQNFNSILRNSKEKLRLEYSNIRKGWRAKSRKISKRESFDKSYRDKSWIRSTSRHSSRVRDPNNSTMAPRTSPFALQIQPGTRPRRSLGNMREQPRCHRFLAFKRSRGRDGVSSHRGIRAQLRGGKEKGKWKQTRHCWRWKDEVIQGCEFLRIDSMPLFIDPVTEPELRVSSKHASPRKIARSHDRVDFRCERIIVDRWSLRFENGKRRWRSSNFFGNARDLDLRREI